MTTPLSKIAQALDALAEDVDKMSVAPTPAPTPDPVQEKQASLRDALRTAYREEHGVEMPPSLLDKLAGSDDPEEQAALRNLLKTANRRSPTALGEADVRLGERPTSGSSDDPRKQAWDEFEATIIGFGNDD